jgi:hypothetical protein
LILQIEPSRLPRGRAQHFFVDQIKMLCSRVDLTSAGRREELRAWARKLPNMTDDLRARIRAMR